MFTGITYGTCQVSVVERQKDFMSFCLAFDDTLLIDLQLGASVAVNGACQTVRAIEGKSVWFDAIAETLAVTNLSDLVEGDRVNVERSMKMGQENGGHEVSGHVDGVLEVLDIQSSDVNWILTLRIPEKFRAYIFNKGFLSINGSSLTVCDLDKVKGTFCVYLIPETLRLTTMPRIKVGDLLNFEVDRRTQVIVDTVRDYLESQHNSQ